MKKEALERRIQLNERDVPQLECPVCRKILPQADTWLKSQDSFQQDQGMRQEEEVGSCKLIVFSPLLLVILDDWEAVTGCHLMGKPYTCSWKYWREEYLAILD